MKKIKMSILLLALSSAIMFFLNQTIIPAGAYTSALATIFPGDVRVDDLKLNGNDILDSNGTTRITVGSTNAVTGAMTVSGALTVSGNLVVPTVDVTTTTPTVVGALVKNASGVLYISTATVAVGDWIKVGGQ